MKWVKIKGMFFNVDKIAAVKEEGNRTLSVWIEGYSSGISFNFADVKEREKVLFDLGIQKGV